MPQEHEHPFPYGQHCSPSDLSKANLCAIANLRFLFKVKFLWGVGGRGSYLKSDKGRVDSRNARQEIKVMYASELCLRLNLELWILLEARSATFLSESLLTLGRWGFSQVLVALRQWRPANTRLENQTPSGYIHSFDRHQEQWCCFFQAAVFCGHCDHEAEQPIPQKTGFLSYCGSSPSYTWSCHCEAIHHEAFTRTRQKLLNWELSKCPS